MWRRLMRLSDLETPDELATSPSCVLDSTAFILFEAGEMATALSFTRNDDTFI